LKINRISLDNFRSHTKTEIDLDKVNFFVGGNNSGKTSILAAVELALTGQCMWTDKAGRGAADLMRQGEKHMTAALDIEGLGAVIRSLPPHTLQVGRISGVNEGQAAIHNFLGAGEDRLRVSLNAGAFIKMSQAEQRAFLFNAYGLSWTVGQVTADLAGWLVKNGQTEDAAGSLAKKAKSYYPANITAGPEIFDAMEKRAKEERKEIKKEKQQAEAALVEMENTAPGRYIDPDQTEQVKIRLGELKKKRDELLRTCGAGKDLRARYEALKNKISNVNEKINAAQSTARSLAEELNQCGEPDEIPADIESELTQKIDSLAKSEASAKSSLEAINKAGIALSGRDRKCPLAPDHLQCCMTDEQLEAVISVLKKEHKLTSQNLQDISKNLSQARGELAAITKQRKESEERARKIMILKGKLNTQQILLDSLAANKADLEKERECMPEADTDTGAERELEQVTGLIMEEEKAQRQIAQALADSSAREDKKAGLKQDIEILASEVAGMEALVKALGPDGLRRDKLAGILEGFVGRVNDRLGRLTEGAYRVSLGKDMAILCRVNGGPVLPLRLLSKSEQLRAGIAVSDALSAAAGLKFLAIDEADILEQDNRDLLAGMLLDLAGEYDQVMVFTTVGDVKPENPGIAGVKMFLVNEGAVKEI